jgi:hypothetical protein
MNVGRNISQLAKRIAEIGDEELEGRSLQDRLSALQRRKSPSDPLGDLEVTPIRQYFHSHIPDALPEGDRATLHKMADHFSEVAEACNASGNAIEDAKAPVTSQSQQQLEELYGRWFPAGAAEN